jgi:hypothetical protein
MHSAKSKVRGYAKNPVNDRSSRGQNGDSCHDSGTCVLHRLFRFFSTQIWMLPTRQLITKVDKITDNVSYTCRLVFYVVGFLLVKFKCQ